MEFGAHRVLMNLGEWISSYKTTFVGDIEAEALKATQTQMHVFEDRRAALQQLVTKVDALIQEYLEAVAARVVASNADSDMKMAGVVSVLDTLLASLMPLSEHLPQLGIADRCIEVCGKIVRQVMEM